MMDPKEAARQKCKTDPIYLGKCLGYDFQEDVHRPLFNKLLQFKDGVSLRDLSEGKNRMILWPRGHFKTSAMVVFIVQMILNYPDARIMIMQGNLKLTKLWLKEIKSHFTGINTKSLLPKLFPEFCAEKLGNNMEFTVPARQRMHLPAATVTVASPRAVSTGQHYDAFFPDDLVNQQNYRNIDLLDKLMDDFDLYMPLIDPGGYTFMTGTRYHHADLYGRVIRRNQGEWTVSVKGASLTGKWPVNDDQELLFPVRLVDEGARKIGFTVELLKQLERDNPETFWAQYMNTIVAAKKQLFPEAMLLSSVRTRTIEKDGQIVPNPEFPEHSPSVMVLDLAESTRTDADHSVIAVGRQRGNTVWITDCVGSTFSTYELAVVLINLTLKHRPAAIIMRKEPGVTIFSEYARVIAREKGIMLPIRLEKVDKQKDAKFIRISTLESRFRNKQLFLTAGVLNERMMDEFTQYPKGQHDDRPDAIAMLVEFFAQGFTTQVTGPKLPWFVTGEGQGVPFFEETLTDNSSVLGGVLID